jgi:hypothetical protein
MNAPDSSSPKDDRDCVETFGGGILIEICDTDPGVDRTIPFETPEERMRRRPTALIEEYLEAGYFNEETARIAREELERRKKQPPATS